MSESENKINFNILESEINNENFKRNSRQYADLGTNTIEKLQSLKILIIGMKGLGIEIAKNIAVIGINTLTIYDEDKPKISDLNTNFYLNEKNLNTDQRIDEIVLEKIKKLNDEKTVNFNYLNIENVNEDKILDYLINNKYNVLIIAEIISKNLAIKYNQICRKNKIIFIYGAVLGLSCFIFSDFGKEHMVTEPTNNEIKKYLIKDITKDINGKVILYSDENKNEKIKLNTKYVLFKKIEGMDELLSVNNENIKPIKILGDGEIKDSFKIGDTSKFKDFLRGGYIEEYYKPKKYIYKDFELKVRLIALKNMMKKKN